MVENICEKAKKASYELVSISDEKINKLLYTISELLQENIDAILMANNKDISVAKENGISDVMIDRLKLTKERIIDIANSVKDIIKLPSPVGKDLEVFKLHNNATVTKKSVPFGVIAMIYESRPNVTIDASVICLKAKNAVILKGGKEAIHSNKAFVDILKKACEKMNISPDTIGFINSTDRKYAGELLTMKSYIDLLIPRGSANLINWVTANSKVPVIETGAGNCHLFIDESADFEMALKIIENAKCQRPSVCNAAEKVLVHKNISDTFIPKLISYLENKVAFRYDKSASKYFNTNNLMTEEEKYTEYLDYILGVIVVDSTIDAIKWINKYGTHHSDSIITENNENAELFQTVVDSSSVYHNVSTRFTDGGEFGFGAEIGIATSKLHARGPMALKEMTTFKYIINGNGQIR